MELQVATLFTPHALFSSLMIRLRRSQAREGTKARSDFAVVQEPMVRAHYSTISAPHPFSPNTTNQRTPLPMANEKLISRLRACHLLYLKMFWLTSMR
jgi:hypothetical protein